MKKIIIGLFITALSVQIQAQETAQKNTFVFLSAGFVTPQLNSGVELLRAKELREQGLSYYQKEDGTRATVGSYPGNTGFAITVGFQKRISVVKGLWLGAVVSNGQTGSSPSSGGNSEAYYFNFIQMGILVKYYPIEKLDLYVRGEAGIGSVLTKNRYLNAKNEQDFFHQFGVGNELGLGVGYEFKPFSNKETAIYLEGNYQSYSTRVEVTDIGDDTWKFGALQFNLGIKF
ncbi:MAG: hypothetical protein ACI8SA_001332 [Dokdonia sp.]|jgi:hypothetical protein